MRLKFLAVLVTAIIGSFLFTAQPAHATGDNIKYGAFAYVWPYQSYMAALLDPDYTETPPEFVVLNIGNGSTDEVAWYDCCFEGLRDRGIKIYGYVNTWENGAPRSRYDVGVDVNRWLSPYNSERAIWNGDPLVDGIFLDQHPRDCVGPSPANINYVATYSGFVDEIQSQWDFWGWTGWDDALVMANVGTAVADCHPGWSAYGPVPDYYVTYEGTYANYQSSWLGGNVFNGGGYYAGNYFFGNDRFVHIVYDADGTEYEDAINDADDRGAGYIFVTDNGLNGDPGPGDNPYDYEPSYLEAAITYAAGL